MPNAKRSRAGFAAWMKFFAQQWSFLEVRGVELFTVGDVIFSKSHVYAKARATGQDVDWPLLQFFRFRQAKIMELRPFYWDTAAILAAMKSGQPTHL